MFKKLSISGFKLFLAGEGLSVETGREFALAAFLGLVVGLLTSAFHWMMDAGDFVSFVVDALQEGESGFFHDWGRWILVVTPAVGAVAGAVLINTFSHSRAARGTDSVIWAYHRMGAHISSTVVPIKSTASVLTVGLGGSAGYEGPMTLIGAATGSTIARVLKLEPRMKRLLAAAGLAAGIGALFRAPLAGAIFGAEIFYSSSDMEYETILPGLVASTIAYTVFCFFWGWDPLLPMPTYKFAKGLNLLPYLALAVIVTIGSRFYMDFFRATEEFFSRLKLPFWTKAAIGGLGTGVIGFFLPEVLGVGYKVVSCAFTTHDPFETGDILGFSAGAFVLFFFAKVLATSLTVGSGGSGGVFAPALVCGASLGAAVGIFFQHCLPAGAGINPGAFALVGMAAFTAAAIRIPLTAIIMVSEISGNHELLIPTMWVSSIAFWLNNGWSLYRSQIHDRSGSPLHP